MQQQQLNSTPQWHSPCTPPREKYVVQRQRQRSRQRQQQRMEHILNYELDEGEALLWSGRPNALRITPNGWAAFIISGLWMFFGLLLFPNILLSLSVFPWLALFADICLAIYLVPGCIILSLPLRAYWRDQQTIYAITNTRILFIHDGRHRSVKSYRRSYIGNVERVERAGERGDLIFGLGRELRFTDIPHVRSVQQMLWYGPFW